ncbi:hypothetical protein Tsubulata_024148 [Turnera subulata]|uniref:F-box domain-containing protein n=1 Tax=Turnera subulata TaxID=218843 RepID=A0A9Q0JS21_9ROSI|nr:hypothetical protein Tsubulata_024148 [Turnera subulata]
MPSLLFPFPTRAWMRSDGVTSFKRRAEMPRLFGITVLIHREMSKLVVRLSSLPDGIVFHLLSFLLDDIKSFVRFSAVSRQWNTHLESFVRDFSFDDESLSPSTILESLESQYVPKIGTFHYTYFPEKPYRGGEPCRKVVDFATSRFVNNLSLNFNHAAGWAGGGHHVGGLACPSLKTLRLNGCFLGKTFSCPTVTSMHLENCCLDHIDLLPACPNLKELCLVDPAFCFFVARIMKAEPKLVRLSLEYKKPSMWWGTSKISAPGLEYFRFVVDHCVKNVEHFPEVDFPSLQCAVIDVAHPVTRVDQIKKNNNSLFELLQGLHKAEYLSLSPSVIQALSTIPGMIKRQPSPFTRLKTLALLENPVDVDFLHIPANALVYLLGGSTSATLQLPSKREG